MGKWEFRKPEPKEIRGMCVVCMERPQKKVAGTEKYRSICSSCDKNRINGVPTRVARSKHPKEEYVKNPRLKKFSYRSVKTNECVECGFTSEFKCQFDVDHIDGNHENNRLDNLQTLCANCHRLKTQLEWNYKKKRPQGN